VGPKGKIHRDLLRQTGCTQIFCKALKEGSKIVIMHKEKRYANSVARDLVCRTEGHIGHKVDSVTLATNQKQYN
jgi:hypothetical protein